MNDFLTGLIIGAGLVYFFYFLEGLRISRKLDKMIDEIEAKAIEETKIQNTIVAKIELDNERYYCYEVGTEQFLCYGSSLSEVIDQFKTLYPTRGLTLTSEDKDLMDRLEQEHIKSTQKPTV